jgi:Methyltransferase domain
VNEVKPLLGRHDLNGLDFCERRWSFVAVSAATEPLFIKVPKESVRTSFYSALDGKAERRLARNEFEALRTLARFDTEDARVAPPVALLADAPVVVTRFLPGMTSLTTLLDGSVDTWAPPLRNLGAWLRRVHRSLPGRNVDGLNVSNVGVVGGQVVVFDPNELLPGPPANDLARFCASLLSRGYDRARLPSGSAIEHCMAFLEGYGVEAVDPVAFDACLERWIARLADEIVLAGRWRASFLASILPPLISLYRRRLARVRRRLIERLRSDAGSGYEMTGRYDSDGAAAMYRAQQESLSLRRLRLVLLARAEVRAIAKALEIVGPTRRILDAPAGTGKLWRLLSVLGVPVIGVDVSREMLASAPEIAGVARVHGDVTDLPFPTGHFDVAVSLRLFHRLPPRERRAALAEFARVSDHWVIASYALATGVLGVRYRVVSRVRRSTEWAPHPVGREQLMLELQLAGLELMSVRPIAGLLSNEVIVIARRRGDQRRRSDSSADGGVRDREPALAP